MRRAILILAMTGLAAWSLPARAQEQTLRFAYPGDLIAMDPHTANETFTTAALHHIYEGLTVYDRELNIVPGLATSWELIQPTVTRFYLRENVKFHNGNAFNADDVVFSLNRALNESSDFAGTLASIKSVTKVDDLTVDVETHQPHPVLVRELATAFIMDQEWSTENGAQTPSNLRSGQVNYAASNAMGTGPFMFVSRQPDVRTEFKANPDWWGEKEHNISTIVFQPIASDATRVAALLSGEIDMMFPAPLQDVDRINNADGFKVLEGPEERSMFIGFDHFRDELIDSDVKGKNPLKDVKVRKAIYHAIDVGTIRDRIMRGKAEPTNLLLAPTTQGFVPELNERGPFDPEMSKALLAEAGYPDGFTVGLDCPNDRYVNDEAICQAVVSMLARIGIKVDLLAQTRSQYFSKILKYDTSMYLLGWAASGTKDAHNTLSQLAASIDSGLGGSYNAGRYSNPQLDELTKQIGVEVDPEKRQELLHDAFKLIQDDYAFVPLHQQYIAWAMRDNVEMTLTPDNIIRFWFAKVN